jgi:hypothetical protein
MKRCFLLLSFFLVIISLASNIAAGVFICGEKVDLVEKEKSAKEKEVDDEKDFEKDKIFHNNGVPPNYLTLREKQNVRPDIKISSLALDAEINPPDGKSVS